MPVMQALFSRSGADSFARNIPLTRSMPYTAWRYITSLFPAEPALLGRRKAYLASTAHCAGQVPKIPQDRIPVWREIFSESP